jgi:hypothetical protein
VDEGGWVGGEFQLYGGEEELAVGDDVGVAGFVVELIESAAEFEFDDAEEGFEIDGLEEERGEGLGGEAVDVLLDFVERHAGEQNDGEAAAVFLEMAQNLKAIDAGHLEVEEQDIDFAIFEVLQGLGAVADFVNVIARAAEEVAQGHTFNCGVIAQKDSGRRRPDKWGLHILVHDVIIRLLSGSRNAKTAGVDVLGGVPWAVWSLGWQAPGSRWTRFPTA